MHQVGPVNTRSLGTDRAMLQNHQVPGVWAATAKFCAFDSFQKRLCARDPGVSLCAQAMRPDLTGSHLPQLFPPLSPAPYPILPGALCVCVLRQGLSFVAQAGPRLKALPPALVSGEQASHTPAKPVWTQEDAEKENVLRLEGPGEVDGPERGREQNEGEGERASTPSRPASLLPSGFCERNSSQHAHRQTRTHAPACAPHSRELCSEKPSKDRRPGWKMDDTPTPGVGC